MQGARCLTGGRKKSKNKPKPLELSGSLLREGSVGGAGVGGDSEQADPDWLLPPWPPEVLLLLTVQPTFDKSIPGDPGNTGTG